MKEALKEAYKAYQKGETPIGAVIVKDGEIIARAHNLTETIKDSTAHAEILAIREASGKIGGWRLISCELYVTMEPCMMCSGAIINSRIKKVVIGARHIKNSILEKQHSYMINYLGSNNIDVEFGVLEDRCSNMLRMFFKSLRNKRVDKNTNSIDGSVKNSIEDR
jgi:tRNA(adenine34) deaminase